MTEDALRHMTAARTHDRVRDAELERLARRSRDARDPEPQRVWSTTMIAFLVLTRREAPQ